jgi:hypothetical protein
LKPDEKVGIIIYGEEGSKLREYCKQRDIEIGGNTATRIIMRVDLER